MSIQSIFVKRILKDEGKRLLASQGAAIAKRVKFHSYRLDRDRKTEVTGGNDLDGNLKFSHPNYERFLDIKRKLKNKKTNKAYTRSLRIHNRFVFGHYSSIANRLMNDFTEEVRKDIRKESRGK